MVKTQRFHCCGPSSISGQENKIPQATWCGQKKRKETRVTVVFSGRAGTHWGPGEPVAVLAHQWPSPKEGAVPSVSIFSSPDPSPCCPQRVPFLCPNWFPLICGGLGRQTSHICWKGISKKKLAWDSVLTGEL